MSDVLVSQHDQNDRCAVERIDLNSHDLCIHGRKFIAELLVCHSNDDRDCLPIPVAA